MIHPPITKDDIGRKFRCRNGMMATIVEIDKDENQPVIYETLNGKRFYATVYGRFWVINGKMSEFDLIERIPAIDQLKEALNNIEFKPAPEAMKKLGKPLSHNEAILYLLTCKKGQWLSLNEISDYTAHMCASRCYPISTRVSNLRARGHVIHNRTDQTTDVTKSEYKLEDAK